MTEIEKEVIEKMKTEINKFSYDELLNVERLLKFHKRRIIKSKLLLFFKLKKLFTPEELAKVATFLWYVNSLEPQEVAILQAIIREKSERKKRSLYIFAPPRMYKMAVLALVICLTGTASVAIAFKSRFIYKIFPKNTEMYVDESAVELQKDSIEEIYLPSYTAGHDLVEQEIVGTDMTITIYESNIILTQNTGKSVSNIDNEVKTENQKIVNINNSEAIFSVKDNRDSCFLIWEEYGYIFELRSPNVDEKELINIAESLQPQGFDEIN